MSALAGESGDGSTTRHAGWKPGAAAGPPYLV